ncbi:alanine racemase [Candidatus Riesia pediculicola]|uniref:Alanine racemase n=1 Tax=Riesia pediculicola (strain USDA) TaxID=515618 RepID=D4G8P9_RIEPU|nr:alanine racemase [Candidatus Riesia pediculicola]ADD79412.1 alanine racemase [Candidatus Riesia pediculicola USDA]ARC53924.1 hypothetical protein AOE55_02080 [Candidatus Riesia pediculicola]QOJ86551.1 alanine racemase [Candidatus Riesia pediculicola]
MKIALIRKKALIYNIKKIQKLTNNSRIIAIVKSNAYGHGSKFVTRTLKDFVDYFGVSNIEEAHKIVDDGIKNSIISLMGFINYEELKLASQLRLEVVVHNHEQINILEKEKIKFPIAVWMKINTGMNRLGFLPDQAVKIYNRLKKCKNVRKPVNTISHFSSANIQEPYLFDFTQLQLDRFKKFIIDKNGKNSIASSSGILFWPSSHLRWVRAGIIMYGISPKFGRNGREFGLIPAMKLKSKLISVRQFKPGQTLGYGQNWINNRKKTYIGIVSIGYGDGYHSCDSKNSWVLINGRRVPVIGSILMDMIFVDLGEHLCDKVGDEVIIWGEKKFPIEEAFKGHDVSCLYRSVSQLTSRVKRKYI